MADRGIELHFLSNVDIDCFGSIIAEIDPESTQMAAGNTDPGRSFDTGDPISDAYLDILFSGKWE